MSRETVDMAERAFNDGVAAQTAATAALLREMADALEGSDMSYTRQMGVNDAVLRAVFEAGMRRDALERFARAAAEIDQTATEPSVLWPEREGRAVCWSCGGRVETPGGEAPAHCPSCGRMVRGFGTARDAELGRPT